MYKTTLGLVTATDREITRAILDRKNLKDETVKLKLRLKEISERLEACEEIIKQADPNELRTIITKAYNDVTEDERFWHELMTTKKRRRKKKGQ